jgi:outer membrane protein assembly factor BamE (lipoprotein component of BamABCDE complex)
MKRYLAVLLSAAILAGCASVGNERVRNLNETKASQVLTKGTTTKTQVREAFGSPDSASFTDSGNEIWKYEHIVSTAKGVNFIPFVNAFAAGADQEKTELVILFDKNGIISNYTVNNTKSEVRQGIFAK